MLDVLDVLEDAVGEATSAGGRESEAVASARMEGAGVESGNCGRDDRKVWRRERIAAQERDGARCSPFGLCVCACVRLSGLRVGEAWREGERQSKRMDDRYDEG